MKTYNPSSQVTLILVPSFLMRLMYSLCRHDSISRAPCVKCSCTTRCGDWYQPTAGRMHVCICARACSSIRKWYELDSGRTFRSS